MLATRVNLCAFFSILLARAITIAIRYSGVRHQGVNPSGLENDHLKFTPLIDSLISRKETLILDYPLQQEKLVPGLATTYAFFLSYMKLENFRALSLAPDAIRFELLPEVNINLIVICD